jgi:hypothetical protein
MRTFISEKVKQQKVCKMWGNNEGTGLVKKGERNRTAKTDGHAAA